MFDTSFSGHGKSLQSICQRIVGVVINVDWFWCKLNKQRLNIIRTTGLEVLLQIKIGN
jgi:hypothetical protein